MNDNEPTDPDLTLDAPTPARENEILAALLANGGVEPEAIGRSLSTLTVLGWRVYKCRECPSVKVTRARRFFGELVRVTGFQLVQYPP